MFGTADEGASQDLSQVASMLRGRIVSGAVTGMPLPEMLIGRSSESESSAWRCEAILEAELSRCFQKAKEILAANRELLDKLADALVENDYLLSSDIQSIKATCDIVPMRGLR